MAIIHYAIYTRNVWRLGRTLNYINILQPIYFNVFLQCYISQLIEIKVLTRSWPSYFTKTLLLSKCLDDHQFTQNILN